MAKIGTLKQGDDNEVIYPQTVYSAVCDTDGTTLAQDMSSVIHSQSVQSVEELPALLRDVKINGTSVVEDGVANVPCATNSIAGVIAANATYGLSIINTKYLCAGKKTQAQYESLGDYIVVGKGTLENIKTDLVGRALADTTATAYTAEQQNKALARLGAKSELPWSFSTTYTLEEASAITITGLDLSEFEISLKIPRTATWTGADVGCYITNSETNAKTSCGYGWLNANTSIVEDGYCYFRFNLSQFHGTWDSKFTSQVGGVTGNGTINQTTIRKSIYRKDVESGDRITGFWETKVLPVGTIVDIRGMA